MKVVNAYGSVRQMHGATKYLMAFASELKNQGHDSSIVCADFSIPRPYWLTADITTSRSNSGSKSPSGSRIAKAAGNYLRLPGVARCMPWDADAVVLHSEHALPLLPFVRRRCPRATVVYYCYQPPREVYDLWPVVKQDFHPLTRLGLQIAMPFYKWLDRKLARSADRVLVFSPEYREYARGIYGNLDYVLVPAGIDFRMFELQVDQADRVEALRRGSDVHLLMMAALSRKKNVHLLIEVLAALAERGIDARGTVIGEGPLRSELEALAQQRGVADRLVLAGYVTQEDLPLYYHAADVLYFLEANGAWTMSIIEAGATRTPVIVAPGGSMPTLVRDGKTGIVLDDVTDVDALVAHTVALAEDGPRRAEMGKQNYEYSLRFSLPESVRAFVDTLSSPGPPAS
jgi:glycosyltransferase involved in cell wall biosynthesis